MCGIVGKYFFNVNAYYVNDMPAMMKSIVHRGPDSSGIYVDARVALGFQRLSIIDTVSGDQPLYNENKKIVLIANGEIYNFKELRSALQSSGHVFRTRSDCEVIIHLYEEYGSVFVDQLNGMFAFCLYDSEKKLLLIARDRMGIKPFYISMNPDVIIFSSEIKGILASRETTAKVEPDILGEYLWFRSLSNGKTFFAGIQALEPGICMEISTSGIRSWKYWEAELFDSRQRDNQLIDKIDVVLQESVQRQMISDVPLGTLLSGGVDSSWVSRTAGIFSPGLKTFTVGFSERAFDETQHANLLAHEFKLDYHEITVGGKEFAEVLPRAIWFNDEPLTHANSVQIYLICKYAKQFVKVLLTGEGADELFGGYPRYYICKIGGQFLHINRILQLAIRQILSLSSARRVKKLRQALSLSPRELVLLNAEFASWEKIAWLFDKDVLNLDNRTALLEKTWHDELDLMDNLLLFEQKSYLQAILTRQDKMSMAASIESRVPILDNQMISLANTIPAQVKVRSFQPKHLFKKAAARKVPKQIVYKKKVGFGVPIGKWLRDKAGLGQYLDLLIDQAPSMYGLFQHRLEKIVKEHRSENANHEDVLWPLVNYAIWHQVFFN